MDPIFLQDLASRKTAWLAARQAVVAANVANANTPGFRAKDLAPFTDVLARTELTMASTAQAHLQPSDAGGFAAAPRDAADNLDVSENGNDVGVETEMIKAGDINREFALTTNITRSFHALLMASLKG